MDGLESEPRGHLPLALEYALGVGIDPRNQIEAALTLGELLEQVALDQAEASLLAAVSAGDTLAEYARGMGVPVVTMRKRWERLRKKITSASHASACQPPY